MRILLLGLALVAAWPSLSAPLLQETGQLTAASKKLKAGQAYALHSMTVKKGQLIGVRMRSTDFQAYVMVLAAKGIQYEDGGPGDAHVVFVAPADGTLRVAASSKAAGELGAYELFAEEGQVSGRLAEGDGHLESGEFMDGISWFMDPDTDYTFRLQSDTFDTCLIVRAGAIKDQDAAQYEISETLGMPDAVRAHVRTSAEGRAFIHVTSDRPGQAGDYTLNIAKGYWPLNEARTAEGELAETDRKLKSGAHRDVLTFLAGEATYEIHLTSDDFEPVLTVVDPEKRTISPAPDKQSEPLRLSCAKEGMVRVIISSKAAGETGAYQVTVTPVAD